MYIAQKRLKCVIVWPGLVLGCRCCQAATTQTMHDGRFIRHYDGTKGAGRRFS